MFWGKPLIGWTIASALSANSLNNILVSTDNEEISEISYNFGARIPFIRTDYLAKDNLSSNSVVKQYVEFLRNKHGEEYDLIALLEPNSPLRLINDIDKMINIIKIFFLKSIINQRVYLRKIEA